MKKISKGVFGLVEKGGMALKEMESINVPLFGFIKNGWNE